MRKAIESPSEYYLQEAQARHARNVDEYLKILTDHAAVNREKNGKTAEKYRANCERVNSLQKSISTQKRIRGWSIFGVIAAFLALAFTYANISLSPPLQSFLTLITLVAAVVGIVLICKKISGKLKRLHNHTAQLQEIANVFLREAYEQMQPLNALFTDDCALRLTEKTFPALAFDGYFTEQRLLQMREEYGFAFAPNENECTLETLSGELYARPFLYERRLSHCMGAKTYRGSLHISWTTWERDSKGNTVARSHSETLHASVTKPYPEYSTTTRLYYCNEMLPNLRFSRVHTHADDASEAALDRKIRSGERKLRRLEEKSLKKGADFAQVENTEFEVLFGAFDRNDELDFREMFTMKAQESMLKLLLCDECYGDDFDFTKSGKINIVCSEHSQFGNLNVYAEDYRSYDIALAEKAFRDKNNEFFKSVFFDFAPLLLIPVYQQPFLQNNPIAQGNRTQYNYEEIANQLFDFLTPSNAATPCIFKTVPLERHADGETVSVHVRSFTVVPHTEYVSVHGGDGHFHNVPVEWDEYVPISKQANIRIVNKNGAVAAPPRSVCLQDAYAYIL